MAVREFSRLFSGSIRRARLAEAELTPTGGGGIVEASVTAGEADPMTDSGPNDDPIPAEHTSPEDVSPAKPEDGKETYEHEIKRIDPNHFAEGTDPVRRQAGLADELHPGEDHVAGPAPAQPPAPDAPAPAPKAPAPPAPPGPPDGAPAPDAPAPGPSEPAAPQSNEKPIFDWVDGLDPVARGQLVNDWQEKVDQKLFSRHTNVIKLQADGNNVTLTVQAYNTDNGAKPDIGTGYAADGIQRRELQMHLREVFQPHGPAERHVSGVYNSFFEQQADLGEMPLLRVKAAQSGMKFQQGERVIEGWSDAGPAMAAEPQWKKTPYTVYTVDYTLSFSTIGGAGASPSPASPPKTPPQPGQGA